jgi:hypothetical protein
MIGRKYCLKYVEKPADKIYTLPGTNKK